MIFRDLKTENVARNHLGVFQLLDFGLAKEVKEKDRIIMNPDRCIPQRNNGDDIESMIIRRSIDIYATYKMTGLTGTVRIMSPEVLQCQPYGLAADVYSFGIIVWEVFRGDRNRLSPEETIKGQYPPFPVEGMPGRIESIVKRCYAHPTIRPTFAMLCQELEYQLLELHQQQQQQQQQDDNEWQSIRVLGGGSSTTSNNTTTTAPRSNPTIPWISYPRI